MSFERNLLNLLPRLNVLVLDAITVEVNPIGGDRRTPCVFEGQDNFNVVIVIRRRQVFFFARIDTGNAVAFGGRQLRRYDDNRTTMDDEQNASESDLIRAWLANHDVECPVCAYNLRTSISQTCPECGAHLDLRVGSADLQLGAWIVSLMGLALPLGFVGIYSAIMFLGMPLAPTRAAASARWW